MMGKITVTGRTVVLECETAVDTEVELVLGELPKKTLMNHVPTVLARL